MAPTLLTAVNQAFAFGSKGISQKEIEAFDYSVGWAQVVASRSNADPASADYFEAMTAELPRLGWRVRDSKRDRLRVSRSTATEPADVILAILRTYLDAEQADHCDNIFNLMRGDDPRVVGFCSEWWPHSRLGAEGTKMTIGPLYEHDGKPTVSLQHFSFKYALANWSDLFVPREMADVEIGTYRLRMSLSMDRWHAVKRDTKRKLGQAAVDLIHNAEIDI